MYLFKTYLDESIFTSVKLTRFPAFYHLFFFKLKTFDNYLVYENYIYIYTKMQLPKWFQILQNNKTYKVTKIIT